MSVNSGRGDSYAETHTEGLGAWTSAREKFIKRVQDVLNIKLKNIVSECSFVKFLLILQLSFVDFKIGKFILILIFDIEFETFVYMTSPSLIVSKLCGFILLDRGRKQLLFNKLHFGGWFLPPAVKVMKQWWWWWNHWELHWWRN